MRPSSLVLALGLAGALLTGCVRSPTPTTAPDTPKIAGTPPPAPSPRSVTVPTASPRAAHTPSPAPATPSPDPTATPGLFVIDLFEDGDFVSQARDDWCVPAAILTMMNVIDGDTESPRPSQGDLDRLARDLSTERLVGAGSEPEGWAGALNEHGYGPYDVAEVETRSGAIAAAARALRETGRPVGLLIWRGAHAWVMTGFEATADPAVVDRFEVTHVRIADPWYPRSSSIWGPGKAPNTRIRTADLAKDFLPWRRPTVSYEEKDGRFVLVLPVGSSS